jgi:hypothetical protein
MAEKLKPEAFAEFGEGEDREGVQVVDQAMILDYVLAENELPVESAKPFASWLFAYWNDFGSDDDEPVTNKDVIDGALNQWCGGREK